MTQRCCFVKYFLLFFVVFLQLLDSTFAAAPLNFQGHKNASINSLILHEDVNHGYIIDGLSFDDGQIDTQPMGNNIKLQSGKGFINLTLSPGHFQFKVCKDHCGGDVTSKIYYEYERGGANAKAVGSSFQFPSCEFNVTGENDVVRFIKTPITKRDFTTSCTSTMPILSQWTKVFSSSFESCKPKIDLDNDNMVQLWVDINPLCPITVLNAKIHVPKLASTPLPSSLATDPPSKESSEASEASLPWWAYLIIAFVVLLALIAVGAVALLVYRDHQKAKQKAVRPPPEDPIPEVAVPTVLVQTPAEKPVKEVAAKPEPAQVVKPNKALKKNKTVEPVTTEDAPVEPTKEDSPSKAVKQNDDQEKKTVEPTEDDPTIPSKQGQATKDEAAPVPIIQGSRNPSPTRTVPQSLKSVKTDSFQFVTKKEIIELAESSSVSLEHHSLKPIGVDVIAGMKSNYPEIVHDVRKDEVDLFCSRVGKMYALICALSTAAEQTLVSVGCIFDEFHRLLSVTDGGRRYLNEKHTAATTVYFAFGAEYHEYVVDAPELIQKASVPLLMVIALQSRFPELVRRQACARLRRKLPLMLCNYKAADREKMPFPINVIEPAYGRAPIMFRDLKVIQSDSSGERKKKKQLQAKDGQVKPGGEAKAKKKSSKKRH